ncbi:MAG TPA: cytidine deaminase [Thermoplasmata archaeon]|nr:cytidine deaminase [Thermoplasmata archaeon]
MNKEKTRKSWEQYFMEMAILVSSRSTCLRRSVGAVIVKEKRVLSTGYNGAPTGLKHCLEIGCLREKMGLAPGERHELCRGIHAEQNAVVQAARFGVAIKGSTLYTTTYPCVICAKILINAGIKKIVYLSDYRDELSQEILKESEIEVIRFPEKLDEYYKRMVQQKRNPP